MLANNIRTIFRSLIKSKSYAILNLLGLTSGLIVFILITLYTQQEFSYDKYHSKAERIYRVYKEDNGNFYKGSNKYAVVPTPLAPAMKDDYPQVEEFFRIDSYGNTVIRAEGEVYLEPSIHAVDPTVFKMLDFEITQGDKESILIGLKDAAISETIAMKYFGRTDVVGETIRFRDEYPLQISGVFKDMPKNSHFVIDIAINLEGILTAVNRRMDNWNNSNFHAFVLLAEGSNAAALEARLPEMRAKYADDPIDEDGQESIYYLQALTDVHFTKGVNFDIAPNADAQALYIYMGIAFMILIIAGINYVNLATARAINMTKEIGIRKVIGALRSDLMIRFMIESTILVFVSILLSILLLLVILPAFSVFIDKEISMDFMAPQFWLLIAMIGVGMTLLSGIYPAMMLSRFKPISALKGKGRVAKSNTVFRNVLVVFQFAISCALILGASVLTKQLNFIQNLDTGYTRDQVLVMGIRQRGEGIRNKVEVFKEELKKIPGVKNVTSSNSLPNNISSNGTVNWVGKKKGEDVVLYTNVADDEFVDLYGLEIVEGRNFDLSIPTDEKAVLINESAVKALGWEEPIGKQMMRWFGDTGTVVGVLKDFHAHSVHLEIEPVQIFHRAGQFNVSIKIEGTDMNETIVAIEEAYAGLNSVYPFEYNFFDDIFDRAYLSEIKTAELANWFTGLAILIACLGLYGLAAHRVQHRIKEVGVRKVLGASVGRILLLLSRDFGLLLLIAFCIAAPVAYYVMEGWLDGFAYHTNINLLTFIVALLMMALVAGLTVGYRTYRAAIRNPVEALREE
ncbi:ABC transporter permease [Roseivirga sp. E12]|uniref:ABC transporter permease n=1 Tax=Roseivirga sp. E12 TaxID=2819237 RepID=UPI001ABC7AB0|nr:ABC transporter permease [Roseivirga sp. E12]MBO3698113.1 ABC transporter permease [Roseivirga sp. E12]